MLAVLNTPLPGLSFCRSLLPTGSISLLIAPNLCSPEAQVKTHKAS